MFFPPTMIQPARKWHLNKDLMNPGRWAENYLGMKQINFYQQFSLNLRLSKEQTTNTDKKPLERRVELISSWKQQSLHHKVCIAETIRIICHFSREICFEAIFLIDFVYRRTLRFLHILTKLLTALRFCSYKPLTKCVMHNTFPASTFCNEARTGLRHPIFVVCETW